MKINLNELTAAMDVNVSFPIHNDQEQHVGTIRIKDTEIEWHIEGKEPVKRSWTDTVDFIEKE